MGYIVDKISGIYKDTGYGEHVYQLASPELGNAKKHSVALVEIDPGKSNQKHYHPEIEETYYIISGEAKIVLDGTENHLIPGQLVAIVPNTKHKIINTSSEEKLVFLVTCAGPWTENCSVFV